MSDALVPGLQMATISDGRIADHRAYGISDVQTGRPVTGETVFEAASLGKPVFAYGVLLLASSGRLDLDAPIRRYLPALAAAAGSLTARQLLSHTAGLSNSRAPNGGFTPAAQPHPRFSYSGEGYRLLQQVVETITGQALQNYMQAAVFDPLGMSNSSYVWREDYAAKKAFGHGFTGSSAGRNRIPDARAHSSLETTASDYARFMLAVVSGRGLSKDVAALAIRPQVRLEEGCVTCLDKPARQASPDLSWGLGWGLRQTDGGAMLWHWGDNQTMQSYAAIAADGSRGVVLLTNSANGHSIIPAIAEQVLGVEAPGYRWLGSYEPYTAPSRVLLAKVVRSGAASLSIEDIAAFGPVLPISVGRLTQGGHASAAADLLRRKEALEPLNANEQALLAEASRRAGRLDQARTAADAALALDSGNKQALAVLEKLTMARRQVPPAELALLAGRYSSPYGPLEITRLGTALRARFQDQPASAMLPVEGRKFIIEEMELPIEFVVGPGGRVTHALVSAGGPVRLDRIE